MNEVIEALDTIEQVTEALRQQFDKMRSGYIAVAQAAIAQGYIIRKAEDNGCIAHAGYTSKEEYMRETFGLEPDAVSRLISMNKQYSREGYSEEIDEKYSGYSKTALQEMLGLPSFIIESLDPAMTKMQIREVKQEYKAESEVTQIERVIEQPVKTEIELDNPLKQFLYHHFSDEKNAEDYVSIYNAAYASPTDIKNIYLTLAPSGVGVLYSKVPGTGRLMASITGMDKLVIIVNMWTEETLKVDFFQIADTIKDMAAGNTAEESWSRLYGKTFPKAGGDNSSESSSKDTDAGNEDSESEDIDNSIKVSDKAAGEDNTENKNDTEATQNVSKDIENVSKHAEEYPPASVIHEKPDISEKEKIVPAQSEQVAEQNEETDDESIMAAHKRYIKERKDQLRTSFNYASTLIQQERWKQLRRQIKDMTELLDDIEKALEKQDVAGQMSMEDMQ